MVEKVRVRFAPSPTGLPHLGSLRTALFNWLFAKQNQGEFILRFEDTDRNRLVEETEESIEDSLKWLGLEWTEGVDKDGQHGPYRQSERLDIYKQHAEQLVGQGRMYRDWTSPAKLESLRAQAAKAKRPFLVRQNMLKTSGDPSRPHVLRFKIDPSPKITWHDIVYGNLSYDSAQIDDFVAIKSDGFPTYNFANVVDDHLMEITHIIRGEEFISSTPKYLQVYRALGWQPPQTAHVPQVLGQDKSKLSKRHGALAALEYKKLGYLPEAIINFLVLLGWHPGSEQEFFSVDQLIKEFDLKRIHPSPAIFDQERLDWFNGCYIRQLSLAELSKRAEKFWPESAQAKGSDFRQKVLRVVKDRLKFLGELPELTDFFFNVPNLSEVEKEQLLNLVKGEEKPNFKLWIERLLKNLKKSDFDNQQDLESKMRTLIEELKEKPGPLFSALRIILTRHKHSPPIWDVMYVLGRNETFSRLESALKKL